MAVFEFDTRVSYDDVNEKMCLTIRGAMGMMQEAAIIHSAASGYSVLDIERTRAAWMLIQWRIKMLGNARWNDRITVRTWPRTMERLTSERDFEIVSASGSRIAVGESLWVLVNVDSGRIVRLTPDIVACYDLTSRAVFDDQITMPSVAGGELCYSTHVCRRDIDTNHHVNNRVYFDYAIEALQAKGIDVDAEMNEVAIKYKKQLLQQSPVKCYIDETEEQYLVHICGADHSELHSTVIIPKENGTK